jgi:hypothetical protein
MGRVRVVLKVKLHFHEFYTWSTNHLFIFKNPALSFFPMRLKIGFARHLPQALF